MFGRSLWLAVGLGISGQAGPMFLKIPDTPGESKAPHHPGWIEVETFVGSVFSARSGSVSGAPGTRTAATAEVAFLKVTDKASPKLTEALCRGQVFPTVRFEFVRSDGGAVRFYVVELGEVMVTGQVTEGGDAARPIERIALDFARATWTYTEFSASGQAIADHQAQWDFVRQQGGSGGEPRRVTLRVTLRAGEAIQIHWQPEPGRRYRLLRASDPAGPYVPVRDLAASPTAEERVEQLPVRHPLEFFLLQELD